MGYANALEMDVAAYAKYNMYGLDLDSLNPSTKQQKFDKDAELYLFTIELYVFIQTQEIQNQSHFHPRIQFNHYSCKPITSFLLKIYLTEYPKINRTTHIGLFSFENPGS